MELFEEGLIALPKFQSCKTVAESKFEAMSFQGPVVARWFVEPKQTLENIPGTPIFTVSKDCRKDA